MTNIKIEKTETTFFLPARDLRAVAQAVTKDESRYYLQGIFVDSSATGLNLVTTDGHMLLNAALPEIAFAGQACFTQTNEHESGFILRSDMMAKPWKAKVTGELWVYGDTESNILQFVDYVEGESEFTRVGVLEFERIDGSFPTWRRVVPMESDEHAEFGVDMVLLERVRKAFAEYVPNPRAQIAVKISSGKTSGDPIRVSSKYAPHLIGIVVPI